MQQLCTINYYNFTSGCHSTHSHRPVSPVDTIELMRLFGYPYNNGHLKVGTNYFLKLQGLMWTNSGAPNSAKFRGGCRGPSKIRQRRGCNIFFTFYTLKI